ncbi:MULTISPECIES: MgtC/SapB family protein [Microcoleaceae]|uniref:MgtC/SapB family protein n=1 Tax=Microcoleaceae TaxID=1892252 RepID=UPI00187E40DA|nr:MgtC/SapB family protein [Tychonema sp. LEGE 06208]MBE9165432.1 MgtC/SapB family protein [Tychonema sp. LEGE 06208]
MSIDNLWSPDNWLGILLRLCLAMFVGGMIGWERQLKNKPAGLRTHMLVSMGAAMFVLIPLAIGKNENGRDAVERVIQGIAAGIGFLGGGEILRESRQEIGKPKVHGLTSAAAIWLSAALGSAAGCGLWQLALIGAFMSLFVLRVIKNLEPPSRK